MDEALNDYMNRRRPPRRLERPARHYRDTFIGLQAFAAEFAIRLADPAPVRSRGPASAAEHPFGDASSRHHRHARLPRLLYDALHRDNLTAAAESPQPKIVRNCVHCRIDRSHVRDHVAV